MANRRRMMGAREPRPLLGLAYSMHVPHSSSDHTAPIRVLIAAGAAATRAGLRLALECEGFAIVAEAREAGDAVELAQSCSPDVCLLETALPGNGIRAAGEINELAPAAAVVMLASTEASDDLFDALRAGAVGYLLMDTDPARLPHALRGVLAGEAAMPRKLVSRLIEEFRAGGGRRLTVENGRGPDLTGREWEVMELARSGISTQQTADRLFVSPVTVRRHMSAVVHKLGAPDRESALRMLARAA